MSFPSSTIVCFFAVFVSIATSLRLLPRSSEPFRHGLLLLLFFYLLVSTLSIFFLYLFLLRLQLPRDSFSSSIFYFMRFETPRYFRRPFSYFASISFLRRVPFLPVASSLRITPFNFYFPFSSFLRLFPVNLNMASRLPTSSPGSSSTTAHIPVPSHFSTHPTPFGCKLNVRGRILLIFHCVFAISSEFTHPRECLRLA